VYDAGVVGMKNVTQASLAFTAASSSSVDDESSDFTTIERRRRRSSAKYTNSATLPMMYTRSCHCLLVCVSVTILVRRMVNGVD